MNDRIVIWVGATLLAGLVGYFGGQIGIAKDLGIRPTRTEVMAQFESLRRDFKEDLREIRDDIKELLGRK